MTIVEEPNKKIVRNSFEAPRIALDMTFGLCLGLA